MNQTTPSSPYRNPPYRKSRRAFTPLVILCLLAALVAAVSPTPEAGAEEAGGGLTLEQLTRLRSVEEVAIHPDGDTVAYLLDVPRRVGVDENGKSWRELHLVDADRRTRPYVTGERLSKIGWLPGGEEIVFLAEREGDEHTSLHAIPVAGGEARRLVAMADDVEGYSFDPAGGRVAVLAREAEPAASTEMEEMGFDQVVFEEEERPVRLWIADLAGGEPRLLDLDGYVRGVAWSPRGDRLAVRVSPRGGPDQELVATKVRVVDPENAEVIAEIDNPGKLGDWAWSPDGRRLALISAADPNDPAEGRLMVVPATGGELQDLLPGLEGHVSALAWRDEEHLLFLSEEGVEVRLGEVEADGGGERTLVAGGGPIWDEMSRAPGGELALTGSTPEHPDEVFRVAAGSKKPKRLTDVNPWLADVRLAPQEVVTYEARDGLEIQGLLIRPLDEVPGERYPLILIVHGGPESHYGNGWLTTYGRPGQVAAGRGYAVFYPNYRASTGRGVEFSKLDHGDPAGAEFDDLVDGVDHLIEIGLVDGERVGVTGGSYGGYATAWCATYYSERFAAAVMFVGVSNQTSKLGTSDIPQELYQVHSRKWPWEEWSFFLERSPIYHVEKARTPILIAGGEDDTRVHPTQSLQLYRYLELLDRAPVRLVRYPGEKHGNDRAAARYDYSLRLMRWMDHYLEGSGGDPPPPELDYPLLAGE